MSVNSGRTSRTRNVFETLLVYTVLVLLSIIVMLDYPDTAVMALRTTSQHCSMKPMRQSKVGDVTSEDYNHYVITQPGAYEYQPLPSISDMITTTTATVTATNQHNKRGNIAPVQDIKHNTAAWLSSLAHCTKGQKCVIWTAPRLHITFI